MAFSARNLGALVALACASCGTGDPDPSYWQPTADLGGVTTPVPQPRPPTGAPEGPAIAITFTTVNQGGTYAPDTYTVVWIEDAAGQYVTTLQAALGIYGIRELQDWRAVRSAVDDEALLDVISGASVDYGTHTAYWEMQNYQGFTMPPGNYVAIIQHTDRDDAADPTARFDLPLGPGAQNFDVPSTEGFRDISVAYPPSETAVAP